ncbi:hypothetical protein VNO80_21039 [Phaseolus coccineus]|uniref:Uncharacterized protein n=1 Tax=Phaseolus coccineus TaxID=3886 RepID=A0AAN9QXB5_PHACN
MEASNCKLVEPTTQKTVPFPPLSEMTHLALHAADWFENGIGWEVVNVEELVWKKDDDDDDDDDDGDDDDEKVILLGAVAVKA